VRAWEKISELPLRIVGTGPDEEELRAMIRQRGLSNVEMLGERSRSEIVALLENAAFLAVPSRWHEPFGIAAVEAFALGVPVIAARSGALTEIVQNGHTGLLFTPGCAEELADRVRWAIENPSAMKRMGQNARAVFEERYTPERNYKGLMEIYQSANEVRHGVPNFPPSALN